MDYTDLRTFLKTMVGLFDHTFKAVMGVPVLRLLLVLLLFLAILSFLAWIIRLGRSGRL